MKKELQDSATQGPGKDPSAKSAQAPYLRPVLVKMGTLRDLTNMMGTNPGGTDGGMKPSKTGRGGGYIGP